MKVRGVITAAGDSRRLGQPKALLEISGETFIERLVRLMKVSGVDEVFPVVGGRHTPELLKECQRLGIEPIPQCRSGEGTGLQPHLRPQGAR